MSSEHLEPHSYETTLPRLLVDNARRFGWYPISNETWHWEFRGTGA